MVKQRWFEQVELGEGIGPWQTMLARSQVREFLRLWGEGEGPSRFTSDELAQSEGLPQAIVPGALLSGLLWRFLSDWAPGAVTRRLEVVFRRPVHQEQPVQLSGRVLDRRVEGASGLVEVELALEDPEGGPCVVGRAVLEWPHEGLGPS